MKIHDLPDQIVVPVHPEKNTFFLFPHTKAYLGRGFFIWTSWDEATKWQEWFDNKAIPLQDILSGVIINKVSFVEKTRQDFQKDMENFSKYVTCFTIIANPNSEGNTVDL